MLWKQNNILREQDNMLWLIKAIREKKMLFPRYNILFPQLIILFPQETYFVPTTYYIVPSIYYY